MGIGLPALDSPDALVEELQGIVIGMGLDVLRQREDGRAGLGGIGQHPHGLRQGRQYLLGAGDPVEEPAHRAEAVVDAYIPHAGMFELLEDRALVAGGIVVTRHQQHRQAVDGGSGGAGDHVGRSGAD